MTERFRGHRPQDRRAGVAICSATLAGAVLLLGGTAPAGALDGPNEAEVLDIVAPVLDIEFATSDLEGAARVEESPEEIRVTLDSTVLFGKDSARLRPAAVRRIREVAAQLQQAGTGALSIHGHTDDLGSAAHGLDLSRRRAAAVAAVLRPLLTRRDYPFEVKGFGEADPAVPNDSEANRRLNRRVEITFRRR